MFGRLVSATIDRGRYALIGALLFAVKYNLDRWVAEGIYRRKWTFATYFFPAGGQPWTAVAGGSDAEFYRTMLLVAVPFVAVGVALTLWRLRDCGLPSWLVVLFFVPAVNLMLFSFLSMLPTREAGAPRAAAGSDLLRRLLPDHPIGSAAVAVFLVLPPALATVLLGTNLLRGYGWGLFVGVPFAVSLASVLLYAWHRPRRLGACLVVALLSVALLGASLIVLAAEGVICVLMASPIAALLALIGGLVGYAIQDTSWKVQRMAVCLLLVTPLVLGAEWAGAPVPPLHAVTTAVDIAATPATVWRHVVAFAALPPPEEPLFRAGIAYPVRATIHGRGVGAVRRCEFSTGQFVEPITVWDEPRLLRFGVISQAPPMEEWTPYRDVHPAHLDGYLKSEQGQFRLEPLPGGGTRLSGTTWYRLAMWPSPYWKLWSDAIIHAIHRRVLRHIEREAESMSVSASSSR